MQNSWRSCGVSKFSLGYTLSSPLMAKIVPLSVSCNIALGEHPICKLSGIWDLGFRGQCTLSNLSGWDEWPNLSALPCSCQPPYLLSQQPLTCLAGGGTALLFRSSNCCRWIFLNSSDISYQTTSLSTRWRREKTLAAQYVMWIFKASFVTSLLVATTAYGMGVGAVPYTQVFITWFFRTIGPLSSDNCWCLIPFAQAI